MVHSHLTVLKGLLFCSSQLSPARPAPEVSLPLCFLLIQGAALCSSPDLRGYTPFLLQWKAELGGCKARTGLTGDLSVL